MQPLEGAAMFGIGGRLSIGGMQDDLSHSRAVYSHQGQAVEFGGRRLLQLQHRLGALTKGRAAGREAAQQDLRRDSSAGLRIVARPEDVIPQ